MMEIVEQLRSSLSAGYSELRNEAADEIERLRAQIEVLNQTIDAARASMAAAPARDEMRRAAIDQLKMAKYVTETDYMEEPT